MTVSELWQRAELDEAARQVGSPDTPVRAYVEALARSGRTREAIAALAQLLPKADAIAWGLESIRKVPAAPSAAPAIQSVEAWLAAPDDERRRAAMPAAQAAGIGTPAGCLAFAVFLSGGSMAPPDAPVAPEPAPHLCARMVAAAMSLASALDPRNASAHLRVFLDRGFALAAQRKIWEEK